ncbi:MAG: MFS transporter, partial [Microvirga sp.]
MHPESPSPARMPWGFVAALSFAQLVSWGIVFYAFALFLEPMARELGWSKPALTLAYSLGLGASAATAYPSGRLLDKGHGRAVMTAGSLVSSALLVLWSRVDSYSLFVLIWIGLGATMSAILYEPGFAVLTHRLGPLSRRGITVMTLVGGLASTVFLPLSYALIEA